ncbi:uncharacterized protein DUF1353 [Yoonia sediminilitoris]|uniref:Uncharacterized protein DUF1353 n=1 Tax=Yoonia sediminilitoris TaxID=1286148 RepID=A0A2T6KFU1_9RHOB|nr:DUF1353 domain-containing protein [Yoonia sediminilitoris]PUB14196.1 uncharacterized protein DUF1353 [Yoonia sediminilitoris]RCW95127.1 uncharacterized protein DUF1353 [Yoonia sediminilitoris]
MKCFDCAYDPQNPYPVTDTPVTDACLTKSLVLFRPSEGIIARDGSASRAGEDLYLTGAPLGLRWLCADGQAHEITVPPGFVTDLTSVPALFRSLVSRAGL